MVVSDLGLPGWTASAYHPHPRAADEALARVPALALTAYAGAGHRAVSGGFDAYLAKPVDPRELVAALVRLTGPTRR